MARKVFYSFHYQPDCSRAALVRNMGVVEGNIPATDNDWESVKRGGDAAIERWINDQLSDKSAAVVLIGANTAGRKWIKYEVKTAWEQRKGLLGIHIHGLKDLAGNQSVKGANPFSDFFLGSTKLDSIVKTYSPPFLDSKLVYGYIKDNLAAWIEEAIRIRGLY
jgi:hypothetical protein